LTPEKPSGNGARREEEEEKTLGTSQIANSLSVLILKLCKQKHISDMLPL